MKFHVDIGGRKKILDFFSKFFSVEMSPKNIFRGFFENCPKFFKEAGLRPAPKHVASDSFVTLGRIPFGGSVIVIDAGFVRFRNTSAASSNANVHPETDKIVEHFHCGT